MKTAYLPRWIHLAGTSACLAALLLTAPPARAGFTMEMDVIRYNQNGWYFYANLMTNNTAPNVPFGTYYVASYDYPTNGSSSLYQFTTNGFNSIGGGSWGYGDFNSMVYELTNGNWSIFVTNTVVTNVYHFSVMLNLVSNDLPAVTVTFPPNGAAAVTNQPVFTWEGPTNYTDLMVYDVNSSTYLPVTQTNWSSPSVLLQGLNTFNVQYDYYSTTTVVASVPLDAGANPISSWVSTTHIQDYISSTFTVGTVDTSGTAHTLVAHYPFDGTSGPVLAAAVDTAGNGYDMTFGGSFGAEGGVNLTADAAAGIGAVQFQDGDGNSAGYLGWTNPTPPALLSALAGSFTVSCWIKTTQNNFGWDQAPAYYGAGIVSADNFGQANDVIPIALTADTIGFNTGGSVEDDTLNSTASVNDGSYHHIVVTRNQPTGQKIIYIDGAFDSFSSGTTNLLDDSQKLTIGALANAGNPDPNDGSYYNGYDGELDDLQIYSGVLSASEVANLFANPGSTAANGGGSYTGGHTNIAHYAFDNSGFLGQDTSGNGNDMDSYSYWGALHQFSTNAEAGAGAVQFFGTSCMNPYDTVLTNWDDVLVGSFTISAWVNTTNTAGNPSDDAVYGATLFWAYNDHNNTNDTIPISLTGGYAAFYTRDHLGNGTTLHSTSSVNDGNYHLITVTRNQSSGQKSIYVDGNLQATEVGTTEPLNGNNYFLCLGGTTLSSYTGLADDVQIYSGVLNAAEVATLYANPGQTVANTMAGSTIDFNTALGTSNLIWSTSGDTSWFVETTNTYDGSPSAAQSGSVTNEQSSTLSVTVTGPGTLTFNWASLDDCNNFYYEFAVDGNNEDISCSAPWGPGGPVTIPSGQHTLTWTTYANGDDDPTEAGFLDDVSYIQATVPVITLNPFSQTNYPGYSVWLGAAVATNSAVTWQWYKVGSGAISGATSASLIPTNVGTMGVAGSYYAVASNLVGSATTATAAVSFVSAPLPPGWSYAGGTPLQAVNATTLTKDYYIGCAVDSTGDLYIAAEYIGNMVFLTNGYAENTLTSVGINGGAALVKHGANGRPVWAVGLTNNQSGSSSYGMSVAAAPGNGAYLASNLSGTNWLGTNQFVDVAGNSILLSRFDVNGSNVWSRLVGGTNYVYTEYNMLVSDAVGNVTLAGNVSGSVNLGGTNLTVPSGGGFIAQYDTNGTIRWAQPVPTSAWGLAAGGGQLYVSLSAEWTGGVTNVSIGSLSNLTDRAYAVACLNATNGQALWLRGVGHQYGANFTDEVNDMPLIATSGTNVFLTANTYGASVVFGALDVPLPAGRGQYFARYDTNGNAYAATVFGSPTTMIWASAANTSGVYVCGDFDNYSQFGSDLIAAPVYALNDLDFTIDGFSFIYFTQPFVAKFDANGNPLWARNGVSSDEANFRGIATASDGVWASGFLKISNSIAAQFDTNNVFSDDYLVINGIFGTVEWTEGGMIAKITETATTAAPVTLLHPQIVGTNFQCQFVSESGFNHGILYRTNLVAGVWVTNSTIAGDGTLKTVTIPLSAFSPAQQGFIRVSTQ